MPPFNLMEIGSSDATESKTFFTSHKTGHSVIFEPRETARNVILNNKIIRKHFNRLILRSEIVVARSGESRSFRRNVRGHLSHIDNSDDSVSNESEFHEIQIDQLKDEVVTSTYLIKMDLEGYELSLLKQLNRTIDVNAPIAILIELHQDKYDVLNAKSVLEELFYNGFKIELIETASHPRPISLISYLSNTPFIISGRRALWSIKENCENDIVQYLTSKSFVYNNFTAEAGYRNIRSVLISRHMNFVKPRKNLSTNIWQLIYKI
jgi:FkbM family methyltransferase